MCKSSVITYYQFIVDCFHLGKVLLILSSDNGDSDNSDYYLASI